MKVLIRSIRQKRNNELAFTVYNVSYTYVEIIRQVLWYTGIYVPDECVGNAECIL
jgi:hypothetical protein